MYRSTLPFIHNILKILVLIILAGGSFYSALIYTMEVVSANDGIPGEDMVTLWERRLRRVKPLLPESGVIGYVSDWDVPDADISLKDQQIEYLLSQYTLAPLVLERGTNHEIVFGNFTNGDDPNRMAKIEETLEIELILPFSNEFFVFTGNGQ